MNPIIAKPAPDRLDLFQRQEPLIFRVGSQRNNKLIDVRSITGPITTSLSSCRRIVVPRPKAGESAAGAVDTIAA